MKKRQLLLHFQKWLTKLARTKFHEHYHKKRWLKRGLNIIKFHPMLLTLHTKKRVKIWKWNLVFSQSMAINYVSTIHSNLFIPFLDFSYFHYLFNYCLPTIYLSISYLSILHFPDLLSPCLYIYIWY